MTQTQHTDGTVEYTASDELTPIPSEPAAAPAELREAAYRAQADQYLTACTGYMLEGRTEEAEEQKALYLESKARIRAEHPDNANPVQP